MLGREPEQMRLRLELRFDDDDTTVDEGSELKVNAEDVASRVPPATTAVAMALRLIWHFVMTKRDRARRRRQTEQGDGTNSPAIGNEGSRPTLFQGLSGTTPPLPATPPLCCTTQRTGFESTSKATMLGISQTETTLVSNSCMRWSCGDAATVYMWYANGISHR